MIDFEKEVNARVEFIRDMLKETGAKGIVFGNSGGKDCALVGILSKMATDNVLAVIMPCESKQNYGSDKSDAEKLCEKFSIDYKIVDLTAAKKDIMASIGEELPNGSVINIAPRLRMTTLYAVAAKYGYLVAGTGNASERYMGYFTKWGDGACDFNPIADLTVGQVYEFLEFLHAPRSIIDKAPSAGLFEGQTDEQEMGVSYAAVDEYILHGTGTEKDIAVIERFHSRSAHKLRLPPVFDEQVSD